MVRTEYKCRTCATVKPLSEFYKSSGNAFGHDYRCKTCKRSAAVRLYQENTASHKKRTRLWYLRAEYGISPDDHADMMKAQGHKCALCGRIGKALHVDHCHSSGSVRGLLCFSCNTTLGKVLDDPDLLRRMADYVEAGGVF